VIICSNQISSSNFGQLTQWFRVRYRDKDEDNMELQQSIETNLEMKKLDDVVLET
jgi:hypothetical protein